MRSQHPDAPGRNAQLARTLCILRDLDRYGGADLYELAERYGTTPRTIRRDLAAIEEVGLTLEKEQAGPRKRWRVVFRDKLKLLPSLLDVSHYLALRVAMGQGGAVRSVSSLFASLEDLAGKIETAVGSKGRKQLEAIEACFHSYEKQSYKSAPPDVFFPLIEAITQQRVCEVAYRTPGKPHISVFEVLPLRIFAHHGASYLMSHSIKWDAPCVLNLHRLERLKLLDKHADPPPDFDPRVLENTAFGVHAGGPLTAYVLRFTAAAAPYVRERTWHPSQQLRDLDDGCVELRFTCAESYEVDAWVASWRDAVEVIEPESLRRGLGRLGAWYAERYRS